MGQAYSKSQTFIQFFIYGKKHFTQTGWLKHSKEYVPNELENIDMTNRNVLITGANSGIGYAISEFYAQKNANVYMVCRNKERAENAQKQIIDKTQNQNIHIILADCAEKQDILKIQNEFCQQNQQLNVLILNAGALTAEKQLNSEGIEQTLAAQLIYGCYYLTKIMIPYLKNDARVITVSSGGMYNVPFPDWDTASSNNPNKQFDGQIVYAYQKRGQVILMEEFGKKYNDIKFVSCHPGWVDTPGVESAYGEKKSNLQPMRNLWEGSEGICWLGAIQSSKLTQGGFYLDRQVQHKHMAGMFFSEGNYTKNSQQQIDQLWNKLDQFCN